MTKSLERPEADTPLETPDVIQIGEGGNRNVVNSSPYQARGMHANIVDQGNEGDLSKTLNGTQLMRLLQERVTAGHQKIVVDLQRHPDLTEQEVKDLVALRERLRRQSVVLEIIGLQQQDVQSIRGQTGDVTKLHTKTSMPKTLDGLKEAA